MNRLALPILLTAISAIYTDANSQEAVAREYGYKLAGKTARAAYFLSGIRRGAEPQSVEAWVWTVLREPAGIGAEQYDARAQWSVLRCTGRTVETLKTEDYLKGLMIRAVAEPPQMPADVRGGTPMESVWNVACDMETRFSVRTVMDLDHAYDEARSQ